MKKVTVLTLIADYCNKYVSDVVYRKDLIHLSDTYSDHSIDIRCSLMNIGFLRKTGIDGKYKVHSEIPHLTYTVIKKLNAEQHEMFKFISAAAQWERECKPWDIKYDTFIDIYRNSIMIASEFVDAHAKVIYDRPVFEDWIMSNIPLENYDKHERRAILNGKKYGF